MFTVNVSWHLFPPFEWLRSSLLTARSDSVPQGAVPEALLTFVLFLWVIEVPSLRVVEVITLWSDSVWFCSTESSVPSLWLIGVPTLWVVEVITVNRSICFCSTGSCTRGRSRNRRTWGRVCASSRRRWGRTTDPASDRWRCGRTWSACWSVSGTASSCLGGWAAVAWGEGACTENSPPPSWRRTAWSCEGPRLLVRGTSLECELLGITQWSD